MMVTRSVQWELGFERVDPAFADAEFGAENRDDLDAIHRTIEDLPREVRKKVQSGKMSKSAEKKFQELLSDWRKYYTHVTQSWYVSDEDLNLAKKKRDDIFAAVYPKQVEELKTYSKGDTSKGVALTKDESEKYEAETKTFFERNWMPIVGVLLVTVTGAYLASAALGYMKLAKVSKLVH